jgi:Bacterial protein of unknown function (DUF916)
MDLQPRQRAIVRAVAALAAAASLALLPSAQASAAKPSKEAAALPGGFGVRPVVPKGKDLPPSYFVIDAGPGSIANRSVVIVNGTKKTKNLIVDGVDGLTGETTGVVYANRDDRHHETSRWLRPSKHIVHVEPGTTKRLRFQVRVPMNVRPGDHVAGLAFEDAHTSTTKSRFAVKQVVRVVVGVQIHIDGGTPAQAVLGGMSLKAQPGTEVASTVVKLSNEGDKLCHPSLRIALQPQDGEARIVERKLDTLLPRDSVNFPMAIPGEVPAGTYGASAKVTGCGAERSTHATLVLASNLSGTSPRSDAPAPVESKSSGWLPIAALVVVGIGGGVGGVLLLQAAGRRRRTAASA